MGDDAVEKTDLERVGLFRDGPFDTEVTLYRPDIMALMGRDPTLEKDDPLRLGGPTFITQGFKKKAATNDWTFTPFLYLWENEPYEEALAWRKRYKAEQAEKILGTDPYITSFGSKMMNGLGTYYGTFFTEPMPSFSPEKKEKEEDPLKGVANFLTNPEKKGTGYGYVDVCMNPYPEHMDDPYYNLLEAHREMREDFESKILGERWVPTALPGDFFDPNPFRNDRDPDGTTETYDWERIVNTSGSDSWLFGPWIPNNFTKCINGNKDVVPPFERFPPYDPSSPWEQPPQNPFRLIDRGSWLNGVWHPQFGNRQKYTRSVTSYCTNLWVNPMTYHIARTVL